MKSSLDEKVIAYQKKHNKKEKQKQKKKKRTYTETELYMMSHLIMGEAGAESWEFKIHVGSVVLNRVKDSRFPNDIGNVIFQKGQFACTWDGNYDKYPTEECVKAAKYLLENGSQIPDSVVFFSDFVQGKIIYKKIGNAYFCC